MAEYDKGEVGRHLDMKLVLPQQVQVVVVTCTVPPSSHRVFLGPAAKAEQF